MDKVGLAGCAAFLTFAMEWAMLTVAHKVCRSGGLTLARGRGKKSRLLIEHGDGCQPQSVCLGCTILQLLSVNGWWWILDEESVQKILLRLCKDPTKQRISLPTLTACQQEVIGHWPLHSCVNRDRGNRAPSMHAYTTQSAN